MASGFIEFNKTDTFYAQWSHYDAILKIIMLELESIRTNKAIELKNYIQLYTPVEELSGDDDAGWGFMTKYGMNL